MTLSQQELAKVRKAAEESVTLSNEMKVSVRATHLDEPADCLSAKHIKAIVSYLINDRAHIYAWCIRVH